MSLSRILPKRGSAVLLVMLAALLAGCGGTEPDSFADSCAEAGGTILSDMKRDTVVTVNPGSGGVGIGSTDVTVRLCVVDGDVVDMEVQ